jgi:DNA-binding NarL/FixJ family response regulator
LTSAVGRPAVKRAYRLLFDAFVERDPVRKKRLARIAAAAFERMGNLLYAAYAAQAAGESGGAWRSLQSLGAFQSEAAPSDGLELTPRQRQIAELVAQGETNRGIALLLSISEHTVEHHLTAIFERLGLHSRAQVAHILGLRRTNSGNPG